MDPPPNHVVAAAVSGRRVSIMETNIYEPNTTYSAERERNRKASGAGAAAGGATRLAALLSVASLSWLLASLLVSLASLARAASLES